MMTEPVKLTINFLEKEPRSAAMGLEQLPASDAAALLVIVPPHLAGAAIALMNPWSAARCIEMLDPMAAAAILGEMAPQDGVTILRQLSNEFREKYLSILPNRIARNFTRALSFPINTVGAWTNYRFPSVPQTARRADALRIVGEMEQDAGSHIFLVNAEKLFVGAIEISELYRLDPAAQISSAKVSKVRPLSARDDLATASDDPSWDRFINVPVVGRKKNFLGALNRGDLRRGLTEIETRSADIELPSSRTAELLVALQVVGSELLKMCLAINAPASPKSQGRKHDRRR